MWAARFSMGAGLLFGSPACTYNWCAVLRRRLLSLHLLAPGSGESDDGFQLEIEEAPPAEDPLAQVEAFVALQPVQGWLSGRRHASTELAEQDGVVVEELALIS